MLAKVIEPFTCRINHRFPGYIPSMAVEVEGKSLEALLAQPPHFLDRLTPAEQKQLLQLLAKVFEPERPRSR
jgi:hypothetical protein